MTTEPAVLARYELASFKEHEAAHPMTNHRGFALLPEPLPLVGKHQQTGGARAGKTSRHQRSAVDMQGLPGDIARRV